MADCKRKTANLFDESIFESIEIAVDVYRMGISLGVLPSGTYTLTFNNLGHASLYHTINKNGVYTSTRLFESPYQFVADGVSEQVIRCANTSVTSWSAYGVTNIMLNSGSTPLPYEPYGWVHSLHKLTSNGWQDASVKEWDGDVWTPVVYGWHVNPSIADSSDAVTYLEDAVGMTPAAMGASTFDYGSWENTFFMPKPCMVRSNGEVAYYLDPNDYSKKADGTPSDVANPDFDGNAMMEWGKIWYKFVGGETDGEGYFYVSNEQVDDSYHCWCNYDSKDNITDHFYTAIYNGTGMTKLRSISGVALTSANGNGGTTVTQEVARATANNTTADVEWYTDVWADRLLINALLVLIGKSLNIQATFGRGLDAGAQTVKEAYTTGTLNDKGLFYGVTANGDSAVKAFGMENWWGCVWHRTAGCISIDRALKIKLTYGTADGSAAVGYNQTGSGYISDGIIPSSNSYVKAMAYNQYGYVPNNVSGGNSFTYYADYFYQTTGTRYLMAGGRSGNGTQAGAFYFTLDSTPSNAVWYSATSLSFKPLAMKG